MHGLKKVNYKLPWKGSSSSSSSFLKPSYCSKQYQSSLNFSNVTSLAPKTTTKLNVWKTSKLVSTTSLFPSLEDFNSSSTLSKRFFGFGGFGTNSGGGGQQQPWVNPDAAVPGDALKRYGKDYTELAAQGKLDPVIGRDEEVRRTLQVLSRRTKNNPVLIGEPVSIYENFFFPHFLILNFFFFFFKKGSW